MNAARRSFLSWPRPFSATQVEWRELCLIGALIGILVWWLAGGCLQSFFVGDDFCNVGHGARLSFLRGLKAVLLCWPKYTRPVGVWWYGLVLRAFGLNAAGYHAALLCLHIVNGVLVYVLAYRLTQTRLVALATTLLFAYHHVEHTIYWSFPLTFDVLVTTFYVPAFLWYLQARQRGGWWRWGLSIALYLLALGTKEMAVTFPLILTVYELLWRAPGVARHLTWRDVIRRQWPYYLITAIFVVQKLVLFPTFGNHRGSYTMVFTPAAWVDSMGWYLWFWSSKRCPEMLALGLWLLGGGWAWWRRDRTLRFGWCLATIGLLPVIFLVHHRFPPYWYLPHIGMGLFFGQCMQRARQTLAPAARVRWLTWLRPVALAMLAVAPLSAAIGCAAHFKPHEEQWYLTITGEHRLLVEQLLRWQPTLPRGSVVVFTRTPRLLTPVAMTCLLQFVYDDMRRLSIRAVVDPAGARPAGLKPGTPVFVFDYHEGRVIPVRDVPTLRPPSPGASSGVAHPVCEHCADG